MLTDIFEGLRETSRIWVATFYAKQFGKAERIQFYESLAGVIEDGIPIVEGLETVEKAFSRGGQALHPVSIICGEVAMAMRGGKSLADACRLRFPYDETSLIEAGETTGNLAQAFRDCVRIIEARQRIGRLIRSIVIMPSITWGLMWVLLYVIALWMVPSMSRRSTPEEWTGIAAFLHILSSVVSSYGIIILAVVVVLIVVAITTLPYFCGLAVTPTSSTLKIKLSTLFQSARLRLESIPPWSIYKALHGSIFLLNMSVMLRTGINQLDALNTLKRSATPWLAERLAAIHYGVSAGRSFGTALRLAGHEFPDAMAVHFLEVLSTRKGFATSMERFANRWLEQTLNRVEAISVALITISSISIGVLMILVVVGIFQLTSGVMDAAGV